MTAWLASIVGVVVIGVILELLIQGRRLEHFVRSIYAFIVLFVIVSPLPNLLKSDWWTTEPVATINTELADNITQQSRQLQVSQILKSLGYQEAIVTLVDNVVYVNLGIVVDANRLNELHQALGEGVVIV